MAQRTCSLLDCERKHLAKGLCASHYSAWHRSSNGRSRQSEYFTIVCVACGNTHRSARRDGKFCSDACKAAHYVETRRTRCPLPPQHPVSVLTATMIAAEKQQRASQAEARRLEREAARLSKFEWRTARECPGCACRFTPLWTSTTICCSRRCTRRVARWRRRSAECEATGSFTWSEFMRVARRFGYRCAYCGQKAGQLDPDHVVPLSRGGGNSTTNLLPSCRQCNGDKRDLMLDEWALDREARGKPPRATNWAPEDKRYWHLTQEHLRISPAA